MSELEIESPQAEIIEVDLEIKPQSFVPVAAWCAYDPGCIGKSTKGEEDDFASTRQLENVSNGGVAKMTKRGGFILQGTDSVRYGR